jgi:prepilin-type N-terminal cleavage/methylation domain-containing protein
MRHELTRGDDGFTLVELLIVVAVIGVLAAIVTSQLMRARASANESAAISSLRAIASGQIAYMQSCGRNNFATSLTSLGPPVPGAAPYISPEMTMAALVVKSGYQVVLTASALSSPGVPDCTGAPTADGFYASAQPLGFGTTGMRSFAVATPGTIWQVSAAAPPAEPFGPPAAPIN